ncbi:MAG TPA: RNA polymerase factor sigma-70 [Planctomycetaceae bacterium]|nr:RNA polymerase factor sigma-70 [Planctomycetaceae bacterium]
MSNQASPTSKESEFVGLLIRHEPVLRAYARTLLPAWISVDDALQEAGIVMWDKFAELRSQDGFLPWAKVIVRFKCLRLIEASRKQKPILSDAAIALLAEETDVSEEAYQEMRLALDSCLGQISQAHRELVLAPYCEHGKITELAEQMGRSRNSLYKLLGRLRTELGRCIESKLASQGS